MLNNLPFFANFNRISDKQVRRPSRFRSVYGHTPRAPLPVNYLSYRPKTHSLSTCQTHHSGDPIQHACRSIIPTLDAHTRYTPRTASYNYTVLYLVRRSPWVPLWVQAGDTHPSFRWRKPAREWRSSLCSADPAHIALFGVE